MVRFHHIWYLVHLRSEWVGRFPKFNPIVLIHLVSFTDSTYPCLSLIPGYGWISHCWKPEGHSLKLWIPGERQSLATDIIRIYLLTPVSLCLPLISVQLPWHPLSVSETTTFFTHMILSQLPLYCRQTLDSTFLWWSTWSSLISKTF